MSIDLKLLQKGDQRTLAKAITLIESSLEKHSKEAQELLSKILPQTGKSIRIGVTGIPGVGKSTFIESLGLYLVEQGKKVAVLAVDPSSPISGGSIMGDKTRMEKLSMSENAFIRPSPSSGFLGGVAQKTRESILLCEAAGFDIILVETVGVGQSEYEVASMVDFFLLLLLPNAGDELQGIKKGILELADILVVNKADGDNINSAKIAKQQYENAIHILSFEGYVPEVHTCSALNKDGLEEVWKAIDQGLQDRNADNSFTKKREEQNISWMNSILDQLLKNMFENNPDLVSLKAKMEKNINTGGETPLSAANKLLEKFTKS